MSKDTEVQQLIINKLTKEQYNSIEEKSATEVYDITDDAHFTESEISSLLETKQNKLTAGNNISLSGDTISATDTKYTAGNGINISEDNVISSTQNSAEWGNITGTLTEQTDLQEVLDTKVNKEVGKSLISDTEIERLATLENYNDTEVKSNISELQSSVTSLLETKQDKLTAGSGIQISDNTISATISSINWGNIEGDINSQTDLKSKLDTKVDKQEGKSLISDTEIERLASVKNYDDTEIKSDISELQSGKQDKLTAGENISISGNTISNKIKPDTKTIVQNEDGTLTTIGNKTKSNTIKIDWVGTKEEYDAGVSDGSIQSDWFCYITDDEQTVDYSLYANEDLSNLSKTGNDYINQSKALTTGNVSSNPDVYADVLKRTHSTFDKSKFTIEGSTSITNDGIASGFSNADCILLKEIDFSDCNTWNYIIKINTNSFSKTQYLGGFGNSANFGMSLNINTDATLTLNLSSNGTAWNLANNLKSSLKILANTDYYIRRSFDGANYKVDVSTDNKSWTNYITLNSTSKINPVNLKPCIGNFSGLSNPINGSIDLKSVAVWADGIPVFNGNKTGLYVAKSDNYTVVGNPTISDDGIASNLDRDNKFLFPSFDLQNKTFKIKGRVKFSDLTPTRNTIFGSTVDGGLPLLVVETNKPKLYLNSKEVTSSYDIQKIADYTIEVGIWYDIELVIDGANAVLKFNGKEIVNVPYAGIKFETNNIKWITGSHIYSELFVLKGSNDLNTNKIYIDDKLAYQPCLKIPYAEADEHSRIVDVAYRNRVQDLYEQTGEALFYTIDEQNQDFTLPSGDIYGMITKKVNIDLDNLSEAGKKVIKDNSGSSFSLFDFKLTDHILTGDEAVGWALQGSLVTNTYPDAVAKIKELYQAGEETTYREIVCKRSQDGRYIADIAQKEAIEALFTSTGVADFYILDSSNNQFYLPKSKWFKQLTTDTSLVNNYNEDGLPNITGEFGTASQSQFWKPTGAFKIGSAYNGNGANLTQNFFVDFDASLSSPVYGNSDRVQPPSSNKLLYYRVGNVIVNETQIDIGNVLSELQLKMNKDFSNAEFTSSVKEQLADFMTPDYASGITIENKHTATCAGYVYAKTNANTNGKSYLYINDVEIGYVSGGAVTQDPVSLYALVDKNDIITYTRCTEVKFYPLKGVQNV